MRGRTINGGIAVALSTSFEAIAGAANAGADLLIVHHAPWAEIDLQLYERKLVAAREAGMSLYAAHEALDRAPDESVGSSLARQLDLVLVDEGNGDLTIGHAPKMSFDAWLQLIATRLVAPPSICDFATSVAAVLDLEVICSPETRWITGGGRAPIEYGCAERAI